MTIPIVSCQQRCIKILAFQYAGVVCVLCIYSILCFGLHCQSYPCSIHIVCNFSGAVMVVMVFVCARFDVDACGWPIFVSAYSFIYIFVSIAPAILPPLLHTQCQWFKKKEIESVAEGKLPHRNNINIHRLYDTIVEKKDKKRNKHQYAIPRVGKEKKNVVWIFHMNFLWNANVADQYIESTVSLDSFISCVRNKVLYIINGVCGKRDRLIFYFHHTKYTKKLIYFTFNHLLSRPKLINVKIICRFTFIGTNFYI